MAAVDVNTYSMKEFQFAAKPEAEIGTKLVTAMQLLNLNGDVTIAKEVVQDTTQRSGKGRTLKAADVHTTDKGGQRTVITVPIILDTTVDAMLHEGVMWEAVGVSPASHDIIYSYAPVSQKHGDTPDRANDTFTCCLISPITDESRYWVGVVPESMTVSMETGADGGRRTASITFVTAYRELDAAAAPTGMSVYGATFRYLYDYTTKKSVGGDDIIPNKIEYTINNPVSFSGFQGASGDPEVISRAVNGGRVEVNIMVGVKYDSNTAEHWENQRDGDIFALEFSDNATWASSTFGIKAAYCKLDSAPTPGDTEAGAFQDLSFMCTGSTTGDLIQIVP